MDDRERFYRAYLSVHMDPHDGHETITDETKVEKTRIEALEREVRLWSPASSVFWALWGIVQGEEQIMALAKGGPAQVDFDYLVSLSCQRDNFVNANQICFRPTRWAVSKCSVKRRGRGYSVKEMRGLTQGSGIGK